MLTAKDYFQEDINTFLNIDEFGEIHKINDEDITILIDNDILKERQIKSAEGTYLGDVLFYVKKTDLKVNPKVGKHFKLDDDAYFVNKASNVEGIYEIVLGRNRS